jgi:hypothetical protein
MTRATIEHGQTATVQKLMTAFGHAIDDVEPAWPDIIDAGLAILIIGVNGALREVGVSLARRDMLLRALQERLHEIVALTLSTNGGEQ